MRVDQNSTRFYRVFNYSWRALICTIPKCGSRSIQLRTHSRLSRLTRIETEINTRVPPKRQTPFPNARALIYAIHISCLAARRPQRTGVNSQVERRKVS
jgi:hypothetical protein